MKKLALLTSIVLLTSFLPVRLPPKANAAVGQWTQANGATTPNYDEFNRSDDTNGTVCATTYSGTPYVCWSENRSPEYKILITKFDGTNWVPPSGITGSVPGIDILTDTSIPYEDNYKYDNPSLTILRYDNGTDTIEVPIIFSTKVLSTSNNLICCSYLLGDTWYYQYFSNGTHTVDKPHVIIGDDGKIYATWCQQKINDYLPIIICADPVFPLVWTDTNGNPVLSSPSPLGSFTGICSQARIDTFNGKPTVCFTYKPNVSSKSDIAFVKWDGANWGGLDNPTMTTYGESNLNEKNPKMVLNQYGSPILLWDTDQATPKTYFSMWNGSDWVNTDGVGKLDLSAKFLGGSTTSNPDIVKGQYGIYHIAINYETVNSILYLQTDLTDWYAVDLQNGMSNLPYGIARPSLGVQHDNYPMIAGDRQYPSDNPAFTEYQHGPQFFVEWGIDTSQISINPLYQDDGKIISDSNGQTFRLRAIINIPPGTGWTDTTFVYNVPQNCKFVPDAILNGFYADTERWILRKNASSWERLGSFPMLPISYWDDVVKVKMRIISNNRVIKIKFGIKFNGSGMAGSWLKNLANVTILNYDISGRILPMSIRPSVFQPTTLYADTSIVTNPVMQYMAPTFYLDASPYSGTISTDGSKVAVFTIFIYPVGLFESPVSLSLETDQTSHLAYSFSPPVVPRGHGVRRATLTITGQANTPPGILNVKVLGISTDNTQDQQFVGLTLYVVGAKLAITKRADRISVQPGSIVTYTITIKNVGGAIAQDVSLEDLLSSDLQYSSSSPEASLSGKKAVWDVGTVFPGQTLYFTLKAKVVDKMFGDGSSIINVANAFYNGWLTSAATVYISVRPAEIPCPNPQAEIKFTTEGDSPKTGIPINGRLYIWDGCNPFNFQLFWGDDTGQMKGYMDNEGSYSLTPHTYETAGTYMISCFITDKYGKQNIIRKHIVIH